MGHCKFLKYEKIFCRVTKYIFQKSSLLSFLFAAHRCLSLILICFVDIINISKFMLVINTNYVWYYSHFERDFNKFLLLQGGRPIGKGA